MNRYIIVSIGESNSGGYALNSEATSDELASRPEVQMWNVNTSVFENLDVGTNNNLDHSGLTSITHGTELQLANDVAAGVWAQNPMYYVQTGQGGSRVAQWVVGAGTLYWTKFLARISAVKSYCDANGITPIWIVWMSIGINDSIDGADGATWQTNIIEWIGRIKTELPGCKILMSELTPTHSTFTGHIRTICDSQADVTFVSTANCSMRDGNHWSYAGMKTLSTRMSRASQIFLGIRDGIVFSNYSSVAYPSDRKVIWSGGTGNTGTISKNPMDLTSSIWEVEWPTNGASNAIVVALESTKDTSHIWGGGQTFIGGTYNSNGNLFAVTNGGAGFTALGAMGDRVKMTRSGNNLLIWKQSSGAWTNIHTFSNVLSGITEAYLHIINAGTAANDEIEISVRVVEDGVICINCRNRLTLGVG